MSEMIKFLDIIRAEGQKYGKRVGYKYIMSYFGTFEDLKNGNIQSIKIPQDQLPSLSFIELVNKGLTRNEIYEIFINQQKYRRKAHRTVCTTRAKRKKLKQIKSLIIEQDWLQFQNEKGKIKINPQVICDKEMFDRYRKKPDNLQYASCRYDIYHELLKMIKNFDTEKYSKNIRLEPFSKHYEEFSKNAQPTNPTSFCIAVERMMTLVRKYHKKRNAEKSKINRALC